MKILKPAKAQAALEFLTTYGWAFLVILIMMGTLAYFGILSPSKILPNRCNFGSEIQCLDYAISGSANTFRIRLKSGIGGPIAVTSVSFASEGVIPYGCGTAPALPASWATGQIQDLSWSTCNTVAAGLVPGQKGKVTIYFGYNSVASGAAYVKNVSGEVYTTVT